MDATVLIANISKHDPHHAKAMAELKAVRERHLLALPAVAFSEALVAPYRHSQAEGRSVEGGLRRLGRVEPVTPDIASHAAQLRSKRKIKLPDALILATATELDAQEILTFDERWRSVDSRVRVLTSA